MFTIAGDGSSATVTVSQSLIQTLDVPVNALPPVVLALLVAGAWILNARLLKSTSGSVDR
jgi:hypothetical protein